MSWQDYIDNQLLVNPKIQKAAILGQEGGVWASSKDYTPSVDDHKAITTAYKNGKDTYGTGFHLGGRKFFTTLIEGRSLHGRKESDGCIIVKTKKAILLAEYVGPTQPSEVVPTVERLADYLDSVGY